MLTGSDRDNRLDLIEFLARHANIRGSIMQIRNKTTASSEKQDDSQLLLVEMEHAKWWTTVDEHLSDHELVQSISKPHQVTLIILRFETVLALHRSILGNPKHDAMFNVALQRCVTASRSIINTLHKALKGFGAFDGSPGQHGYESTPLLWPSFTWAIWMSTFIVIFAATENQLARKFAIGLADRSVEVLRHIALRGTQWPESCIVAIKNLVARLRRPMDKNSEVIQARDAESTGDPNCTQAQVAMQGGHPTIYPLDSNHDRQGQRSLLSAPISGPGSNSSVAYGFVHAPSTFNLGSSDRYNPFHDAGTKGSNIGPSNYLNGSGDFLGLAQQSSDVPRAYDDIMQLFNGEDLSWWISADHELYEVIQ